MTGMTDRKKIELAAGRNNWDVHPDGQHTLVLRRATRSITVYFEHGTGAVGRAFAGHREIKGPASRLAHHIIRMMEM